ncbi:ferredoxin--NADP reductase [Mycolicibacterium sphagni]|uniref:3-ketosteroid-9-alpha-hydroxylase n=1 Tax=Mycolicibacterium sphagni TaxID=1786 RepID=A0A255DG57_9MYCO|nr:ferredoxin--NADP reductase [Mycolicibacterium sphagni]OYN76215.1 3-ketosteroid-9-alpha-hydroxylase [Mycolicibacterium sphagni]
MDERDRRPAAHTLRVAEVVDETEDTRSIVFDVDAELRDRFSYRPGQFLTLRIPSERTGSVARCYSLASSPHCDDALKVTVKRTRGGFGSNWLCDNVTAGASIDVLPPSGQFTPADLNRDFLLFAGGSGITPVFSILRSMLACGAGAVTLFYANRNETSVIFSDELRALSAQHPERLSVVHWLESVQGIPTREQLRAFAEPFTDRDCFTCGPGPFMAAVAAALTDAGVPRARIHLEAFTSLTGDPFAEPTPPPAMDAGTETVTVEVELAGQSHQLDWPVTVPLLDLLIEKGLDVPYLCRTGDCGTCQAVVEQGKVRMIRNEVMDPDDVADGYVLGCQTLPDGEPGDRYRISF